MRASQQIQNLIDENRDREVREIRNVIAEAKATSVAGDAAEFVARNRRLAETRAAIRARLNRS